MPVAGRWGALVAALLLGGCGEEARSLLPIDVEPGTVTALGAVELVVRQESAEVAHRRFDWKTTAADPRLHVGIYLDPRLSGLVEVQATAYAPSGAVSGRTAPAAAPLRPSARADLLVLRLERSAPADAGAHDAAARDAPVHDAPTPDVHGDSAAPDAGLEAGPADDAAASEDASDAGAAAHD